MNQEAKEYLDLILAKDPASITDEERAFLMARRDYLSEEEMKKFSLFSDKEKSAEPSKVKTAKGKKTKIDKI